MADYTTRAAVKNQLNIGRNGTLNTVDDDLIDLYVTQASALIDSYCQRTFSESIGTLDYYDACYPVVSGRRLYFSQDYLGVDSISNGANGTLAAGQYRLLPLNGTPKYAVQLLDSSGLYWQVGNDGYAQKAIVVSGTVGFCTAANRPADITLAATRLAAWLYQSRDRSGDTVQMADGTTIIPSGAPAIVFKILDRYVRRVAASENSYA